MDYIVNPSLFYWADVFDGIKVVTIFAFFVMLITIGGYLFYYHGNFWGWNDPNEEAVTHRNRIKRLIIISIILFPLAIFLPFGETLVKMYIARFATGSNVELVIQKIIDVAKEIKGF